MSKAIGVLALQGGFEEHVRILDSLGARCREVRLPSQISDLDGLVIPGGESTSILKLADEYGLRSAMVEAASSGMAVWGTCAGMIVIARQLVDPEPEPLGLMDIKVSRNWYGRQIHSFEVDLTIAGVGGRPFPGVFIRAPAIVSAGPDVECLASLDGTAPVAVRSGQVMATAFHPELTDDNRVHKLFLDLVGA